MLKAANRSVASPDPPVGEEGGIYTMCGIIGIVGIKPVTERLIDSLRRLEYRGYDSAGVATLEGGKVDRRRASGKLRALEALLAAEPLGGTVGIGHTRMGDPRRAEPAQRPSADRRPRHPGPQRDHRELRRAEG